jgi:cytosine/adenosine deaminase-related metal-dependent hydrolase
MFDLLIHNANLPDGRTQMSVAVQDGKIVALANQLPGSAHQVLDAQSQLLCPPFVDAHFHMDATLSYGLPRVNQSGTLLEGIALWGELKPLLTEEALMERALAYCDWAVARGLLAIRSHVDVCDPRLLAVRCAAGSQTAGGALYRPAAGRLSARRRAARTRCAGQFDARAGPGAWTWSAAFRTLSAPWPTARRA